MKSNVHRQSLKDGHNGSNVLLSRALHLRGEQQQTCEGGLAESTQEVAVISLQNMCTVWTLWPYSALTKAIWDGKGRLRWGTCYYRIQCRSRMKLTFINISNRYMEKSYCIKTMKDMHWSSFCVTVLLILILEMQLQCSFRLFSLWCNVLSKTICLQMAY